VVDTKTLVTNLAKDPGPVFREVIRASPTPIRAQDIKRQVLDAGAKKADVDRQSAFHTSWSGSSSGSISPLAPRFNATPSGSRAGR
jgi:hypothetical protein